MAVFSRRNNYNNNDIQIECASDTLKRRIWSRFYKQEFNIYSTLEWSNYTTGIENMMIEMGVTYEFPENQKSKLKNAAKLEKFLMESKEWYIIYDFIERYLKICDTETFGLMKD